MARSFTSNCDMLHISTKLVPVEAAHSISIVKRYHNLIRRDFKNIITDDPGMGNSSALQMAVKSINDSVGPYRIVPTLLIFGAIPRQ